MPDDATPQEHALAYADEAHQWQQRAAALAREGVTQRERIRALEADAVERDTRITRLEEALTAAKLEHTVLEDDCWYSCPKSGESCNDDADPNYCTCGADAHNAAIDRALKGESDG